MNSHCCIYARVSTEDKQSNDRQIRELTDWAKSLNLEIKGVFEDKISGSVDLKSRVGFNRLVEFINTNNVKKVLVWDITRIARSQLNFLNIVHEFKAKGVGFLTKNEGFDTSSDDPRTNFHMNLMASFGQMEREEIKARIKSGVRNAAKAGGTAGYRLLPYGFYGDGGKLKIHLEESVVIKKIFNLYLNGNGTNKIANYLNDQGIETRYNKLHSGKDFVKLKFGGKKKPEQFVWRDATVYGILTNTIYKGERKFNNEIITIEAIISDEIFDEVQLKLKSNYNKLNSNRKYQNIFQGKVSKIKCGSCGKSYFMHKRADNKDNSYKCLSKRFRDDQCDNASIGIDKLNNAIYDAIYDSPFYDFSDEKKILNKTRLDEELEVIASNLNQVKSEIQVKTIENQKLLDVLLGGLIKEQEFVKKRGDIEAEISSLNSKLANLTREQRVIMDSKKKLSSTLWFDFEDIDYFKNNIKDYISYIRIIEVTGDESLRETFKKKQDRVVLVEVSNAVNFYSVLILLSQRENFYIKLYHNAGHTPIPIENDEDNLSMYDGLFINYQHYYPRSNREDLIKEASKYLGSFTWRSKPIPDLISI